jgi:hypothetical protein
MLTLYKTGANSKKTVILNLEISMNFLKLYHFFCVL